MPLNVGLVAALLLAAEAPPAPPVVDGTPLERARVCWAAMDADCAEEALVEARAQLTTYSPETQTAILSLSAEVALAADRKPDALGYLRDLLERDPRFQPSWPPAWLAVVDEARKALPDRLPPELELFLPAQVPPKKPVKVAARAHDPSGVQRVVVRAAGRELVLMTADGENWGVELPADIVKVPDVSLDTEAVDKVGNVAHRTDVLSVVVPPKPLASPSITERWWFWTAIGVGVAAIATTIVLVSDSGDAAPSRAGDGTLVLDILVDPEPAP